MNEYIPAQYTVRLTVGEHAPRHVRRIVRSFLEEWRMPELSDAVELGVTELLANVVQHVPDRHCTLLLLRQPAGVRVEVTDGSDQLPASPAQLDPESEGGRGLLLLDAMADKWGVSLWRGGGKTVWFECGAETVALE
ncbi:ATP-binding protein [Streptomyces caelestis]|uniref:Anti-sigma regulatory factor (Ser/Thr protein kinase) n=1 Tax=Streptomyces caelestis TaxID=36816 RepID=A0A7W9LSG1_9ACTN|nr:ATP-binding protein [Streptomyces caelestis]MBB5794456.1 anti-sigma regulatory factor (Ser/Thr protein kinase) [Streptomyces caelestis]GGW30618.1 ATP-binding protein [Streptomyces caelestis]